MNFAVADGTTLRTKLQFLFTFQGNANPYKEPDFENSSPRDKQLNLLLSARSILSRQGPIKTMRNVVSGYTNTQKVHILPL